jgi:hypothetical protein
MDKEKREKIEAFKRTYITMKLDLSTTEAETFWPVYNEFDDARHELVKSAPKPFSEGKTPSDYTDEELEEILNQIFEHEQSILDLKIEYSNKFKEVLPLEKVVQLDTIEAEFRKEIVEKFSAKRGEGFQHGR